MSETFNWVDDYVIARKILGWSDEEFWSAHPRKFFAVYYTYLDFQERMNNIAAPQKPLIGEDAIQSLQNIAKGIR